jgi:ribosomal protein L15E
MTADQPLQPGDRVWIEAEAVSFVDGRWYIAPVRTDERRSIPLRAKDVRWRPMPREVKRGGFEQRTWALPAEPGPEVTAVTDAEGRTWTHEQHPQADRYSGMRILNWRHVKADGNNGWAAWSSLLNRGPLTDASEGR